MDRTNSFSGKIPPNGGSTPPAIENTVQKTDEKARDNASPAAGNANLPAPSLSTRPKLTRQKVYGDMGDPVSSAAAVSNTESRRTSFHASVDKAKASRLKNPARVSVADLTKTYPVLSTMRSARKEEAGAGIDRHARLHSDHRQTPPALPAWRREGTAATVELIGKRDMLGLVSVLRDNPDVSALKIVGDFGGQHGLLTEIRLRNIALMSAFDLAMPEPLDDASFRSLLSSLHQIRSLDLTGCRLTEQNFIDLSVFLQKDTALQSLTVGGGDLLSMKGQEAMAAGLAANLTLRELVLESLYVESASIPPLLQGPSADQTMADQPLIEGIKANRGLETVKLQHLSPACLTGPVFSFKQVTSLFGEGSQLREVSFADTRLGYGESTSGDYELVNDYLVVSGLMHFSELFRQAGREKDLPFNFGERLEVLDLSGCSITRRQLHNLISSLPLGSSLSVLNLDTDKMDASYARELQRKLLHSKPRLIEDGTNAYQWLVSNSANAPQVWPREVSTMLAMHTSIEDLITLGDVLADSQGLTDSLSEEEPTTLTTTTTTTAAVTTTTITAATTTTTTTTTTSPQRDQRKPSGN